MDWSDFGGTVNGCAAFSTVQIRVSSIVSMCKAGGPFVIVQQRENAWANEGLAVPHTLISSDQ